MWLVSRRAHSPPFKGGVAAQRPGWLVKGREASLLCSPEGRSLPRRCARDRAGVPQVGDIPAEINKLPLTV
jgi:hypothetical protein